MNQPDPQFPILTLPPIESQDIDQEAALFHCLHPDRYANRALIAKRMMRSEAYLMPLDTDVQGASPMPWSIDPLVPYQVTSQLVQYALSHGEAIANLIYDFLDDPTDAHLEETLQSLRKQGVIEDQKEISSQPKAISLAQAILNLIDHDKSATLESLYHIARGLITSKRPESAVRQAVRRLLSQGTIKETSHGIYSRA